MTQSPLDAMDEEVRKQSYAALGKEIELLDHLVLHINHGKSVLTGQKHDRGLNFLTGILLARAFNSLWRAREDAVLGYYAECLTLCRSALEHWATARWVELYPESLNMLLWAILEEVERPPPDVRVPSTNDMLGDLGDLAKNVRVMYDVLSKFAHPRSIGLRWLIDFDEEATYFHVGSHFDEHRLKTCLYFLVGTAQACLEPVARLQNRMLGSVDEGWLKDGRDLSSRAGEFMRAVEDEVVSEAESLDDGGEK